MILMWRVAASSGHHHRTSLPPLPVSLVLHLGRTEVLVSNFEPTHVSGLGFEGRPPEVLTCSVGAHLVYRCAGHDARVPEWFCNPCPSFPKRQNSNSGHVGSEALCACECASAEVKAQSWDCGGWGTEPECWAQGSTLFSLLPQTSEGILLPSFLPS